MTVSDLKVLIRDKYLSLLEPLEEWFSFHGLIARKSFVIRIVTIWLLGVSIFLLASDLIEEAFGLGVYLILKSLVELIIICLCLPTLVKRLVDIGWPGYLAALFVVADVLSARNYILSGLYENDASYLSSIIYGLGVLISIAAMVFLLVLVFKEGNVDSEDDIADSDGEIE